MRRVITAGLILAVMAGTMMVWSSLLIGGDRGGKATLAGPKGTVQVQKAGKGEMLKAQNNQVVYEGDVILTKGGSSVLLKFDNGSMVKIGSLTRLVILKNQSEGLKNTTQLDVTKGKFWSRVNKLANDSTFNVRTPTAVAGVRGTYYSTQVDFDESSRFNVFEGEVEVGSRQNPEQKVLVKKNQTTKVSAGKQPETPSEIPKEELEKEKGGFSDNEFTAASYNVQVSVYPQEVGPGQTAVVTVQVFKGGAPAKEQVHLTVTLGGSATFVSSGSNQVEVDTNNNGVATLEVVSEEAESVAISVKMKALVKRNKTK